MKLFTAVVALLNLKLHTWSEEWRMRDEWAGTQYLPMPAPTHYN